MSIIEWSKTMGPDDMTVDGLARLEAEVFRPYPEVQRTIEEVVADFKPKAEEIERRHGGRLLMAPVQARLNQDYRASKNFGMASVGFLIVLMTACAFATAVRGSYENGTAVSVNAVLMGIAAVACVIKLLSTLRDRVWVGVVPRWAIGASVFGAIAALVTRKKASKFPALDVDLQLGIIFASTAVLVVYAALAVIRQIRSRRALKADLADVMPKAKSYEREFAKAYSAALARIRVAVETIDMNTRNRLKNQRNGVVGALAGTSGLYQGRVPLGMSQKELGEFQLFAVAEPLLGGGPYPKRGRIRRNA